MYVGTMDVAKSRVYLKFVQGDKCLVVTSLSNLKMSCARRFKLVKVQRNFVIIIQMTIHL